jgi:hypothetical protein
MSWAYTYKELLQLIAGQLGRRRLLMPVPYFVWRLLAAAMTRLPNPPISRGQVVLMKRDNLVGPNASSFADLGLEPHGLEQILPAVLSGTVRRSAS